MDLGMALVLMLVQEGMSTHLGRKARLLHIHFLGQLAVMDRIL